MESRASGRRWALPRVKNLLVFGDFHVVHNHDSHERFEIDLRFPAAPSLGRHGESALRTEITRINRDVLFPVRS